MATYKGVITFASDYNKSFEEFKDEFSSAHVFKNTHPNDREKELKEAFKIATAHVNEVKKIETDGDLSRTTNKSKAVKPEQVTD